MRPATRARLAWWSAATLFAVVAGLGQVDRLGAATWAGPTALFWVVVVGAGLCWVGGVAVVAYGWRADLAQVSVLGAALTTQSAFGLVHGLTAPGVLYAPTHALTTSVLVSVPAAMLCALPLIAPGSGLGQALGRAWRPWTGLWLALSVLGPGLLLLWPNALPAAGDNAWTWSVAGAGLLATAALAWRQLELYEVGRSPACLVVSIALLSLGFSSVAWIGAPAFSAVFWAAHAMDVAGVIAAALGALVGYRTRGSILEVLEPVTSHEPLTALALGMDPLVQDFVRDLDGKDRSTREHVVRVAEIAVRTGDRMGLPAYRLRLLGLGALLHDVGKLAIADEILTKPGRLTEEEMAVMRTHADLGADLLLGRTPELAAVAPIVRAHHERIDGRGYPRGLSGHDIPLEARIVAVCDAYDAMCKTRVYRTGLGHDRAAAVLREHAGTQWDAGAVDALLATVGAEPSTPMQDALADVRADSADEAAAVCADVLPAIPDQPLPERLTPHL